MTADGADPSPVIPGTTALIGGETTDPIGEDLASLVGIPHSDRYQLGETVGTGGMGEVLSALDTHIGREVAVKRLRATALKGGEIARFVGEARVQGRLDHPAIVPIHDLAVDDAGRPFFSMKKLTGVTLHEVIHNGDANAAAWTRARLLGAFVDVCFAVEFAHTRGVIHRDLKPANIILGDFNDVYVIDWGIARALGETGDSYREARASASMLPPADNATSSPLTSEAAPHTAALTIDERATEVGVILGTPGYMAPEQVRGEAAIGPSADIYALGTILFEILAGQRLHSDTATGTIAFGIDAKPSLRAPDRGISPELDTICERATAVEAADRFPTARAFGEAVQGYLDGDRDLVVRRGLAQRQLDDARAILAEGNDNERRRTAMRAAGRALALDSGSGEAAELIAKLLLEPPSDVPPEVCAELDRDYSTTARRRARSFSLVALGLFSFLPVSLWLGVRDWTSFVIGYAVLSVSLVWALLTARQVAPRPMRAWVHLAMVAIVVSVFAHLYGAIIIGPMACAMALAIFSTHPHLRRTSILLAVFVVAMFAPLVLEQFGVVTRSFHIDANGMHLIVPGLTLRPPETQAAYALAVLTALIATAVLTRFSSRNTRESQQRIATQAWQLRQLLPEITTGAATARR